MNFMQRWSDLQLQRASTQDIVSSQLIGEMQFRIHELEAALRWYAEQRIPVIHPDYPGWCDDGNLARKALGL